MAKLFLRTTRKSGIAKLYTRVQRNGLNMIVCTGVSVNIKEWQKAEKSLTAMSKFENTEEGKKVHEQTQEVLQIIDKLFVDGKILSVKDKTVIDQAIKRVVNAESQLQKHVNTDNVEVAILNAFPLFLYEYFK
jgi:hypothetical protein